MAAPAYQILALPHLVLATDRAPWACQPAENVGDHARFIEWLTHQPPRPRGQALRDGLDDLWHRNLWRDRAAAWDAHIAHKQIEIAYETALSRNRRWAHLQRKKALVGEKAIDRLLAEFDRDSMSLDIIRPETAGRYVDEATRLEREVIESMPPEAKKPADLSGLSDEEFETLKRLHTKAGIQ